MCYQLPGQITFNGQPIRGGTDINATDAAFAKSIYPPAAQADAALIGLPVDDIDWPESEDVLSPV